MKYKQYQKYKDSGVEWIGEIPEHWEVRKLKFTTKFENSTVDRHVYDDEIPVSICHYPQVYNNETISLKTELPKGTCNQKEFENFRLKKDDVLITKDSETPDDIGVPVYILDDFKNSVCGYHIAQLSTDKNQLLGGFLFRFIQSSYVNAYFETEANGITRYGLGKDSISNLIIPLPPKPEQEKIYDFLQKETKQFDDLISKSKQQVNFLQEKRQALITHAVTKGLDPTVPMKDSGIEWIGEIPEHWEVMRLRRLCRLRQGLQIPISDRFDEQGPNRLPYITVKSIHSGQFDQYIENPSDRVICYENDVLLARTGNTGEVVTNVHGVFHNNFFAIDFDNKRIDRDYLIYFLEQKSMKENILLLAGTTTIPDLNHDDFLSLVITVPPYEEREQISQFLDKETTHLDDLISKSQTQINFLQEKRQALITSAVTGKIDVRK